MNKARLKLSERQRIGYLKAEGHAIIDEMRVKFRINADVIYRRMRLRLGRMNGKEHFRNMTTVEEVEEAIDCLRELFKEARRAKHKRMPYEKKPRPKKATDPNALPTVTLSHVEQKKALGRLKEEQRLKKEHDDRINRFPRFLRPLARMFLSTPSL